MRHVSAIAKKPDSASSPARAANSQPSEISSVTGTSAALEDQLEHDLAAHVGEQQRREPGEHPVHRLAAAPAAEMVPREQSPEDEPRDDREDRLVGELHRLAPEPPGGKNATHGGGP